MQRVFSSPPFLLGFVGLSFLFFVLSVALPTLSFMATIARQSASLSEAIGILLPFMRDSLFELDTYTILFSLIFSVLVSLNCVLTVFFIRTARSTYSSMGIRGTLGGTVASIFGLGCASCGSLLVSTLSMSTLGASIISLFPFHGAEIGYLGFVLLFASAFKLVQNINNPQICVL